MIGLPQFGRLLGRNLLYLAPLRLDGQKFVIRHGHRVGIINHRLQALKNGLLTKKILFAYAVEFLLSLSTFLADNRHYFLEFLFFGNQLRAAVGWNEGFLIVASGHGVYRL